MAKLNLSVAVGDYDRTRAADRRRRRDRRRRSGVHDARSGGDFLPRLPRRRVRHLRVVAVELSRSRPRRAIAPTSRVPAFVSRTFRHTSIYVRTDRVKKPEDLKGRKVGLPEYQLTANVWARAILEDDYGVKPSDIHWIRGGIEHAGPAGEDHASSCPPGVRLDNAPDGRDDLRAARRARSTASSRRVRRRWSAGPPAISAGCFPIRSAAAKDYFKRTGIFPIMHLVGVRRTLAEKHPWLPAAVLKAFEQAKAIGAGAAARIPRRPR